MPSENTVGPGEAAERAGTLPVLRRMAVRGAGPRPMILLRPRADLDLRTAPRLRDELRRHLDEARSRSGSVLVLHLGGRHVDAAGLTVLLETADRARHLGSTLVVVAPQDSLRLMAGSLPARRRLPLFASMVEMVAAHREQRVPQPPEQPPDGH